MNTMRRLMLCAAMTLLPAACTTFQIHAPAGFAELTEDERYDYRATNADGVVIAVRALRNSPEAGLEFWGHVVDERLRRDGYLADGAAEAVHDERGVPGVMLRYHCTIGGRAHRYLVAVYVRGSKVYVLEAGGDREVFDPVAEVVERSLRSFHT